MLRVEANDVLKRIKWWKCSEWAIRISERYGYLPYMVCRYEEMLGREEALQLLESFENFKPRITIRVNDLVIDPRELINKLEDLGFRLKRLEWCSYCLEIVEQPPSPSIGATHEYLKGLYFVYRDPAPTVPPIVLDPRPGAKAIDVCAAPGGKATHVLQIMRDEGLLVANDKARSRIPILLSHFVRMRLRSFVITWMDARELPKYLGESFDYVVTDVPCSAEGGIMFDPTRKTKTKPNDLAKLVAREIEILGAAVDLARPGARIVYSTCSIAPEENEFVVSKILEAYDDLKIVKPKLNLWDWGLDYVPNLELEPEVRNCIRIWPHRHGMQGFFVCLLEKS